MIDKTFLKSHKKYHQQNYPCTKWINPTLVKINPTRRSRSRQHCTRCSECNCTKIMHVHYILIFQVSWIQTGCSMCIVYAERMINNKWLNGDYSRGLSLSKHWRNSTPDQGLHFSLICSRRASNSKALHEMYSILAYFTHTSSIFRVHTRSVPIKWLATSVQ